jgi:hypothetical protein
MRYFIVLLAAFLVLTCEDKQSKPKKPETVVTKDTISNQKPIKKEILEPEREFPKLTDKNAMEFFLEYDKHNKENKVRITTDFGEIDILLFDKTKFHRANFIFLTKQHYFDGTQFYRVIDNFVIQGGSSDDKKTSRKRGYIGKYLLPPDTKKGYRHTEELLACQVAR